MSKLTKVFLVIGALVLSLIVWMVFFNEGGALQRGWNTVITPVNETWEKISGNTDPLIPTFEDAQGGYDGSSGLDETSGKL
ncbi:hypothetical protein D3C81_11430 [compost metagenome]